MKKLMMIAAGVLLAGSSFGYSYQWAVGPDAITDDGSAVKGATVYLFNARDFSQEQLVLALDGGSSLADIAAANGMSATVTTDGSGIANTYSAAKDDFGTVYEKSGVNKFQTYFALANDAADKIFVSKTGTFNRDESSGTAVTQFDFDGKYVDYLGDNYQAGDGWSASGWYQTVPEPTSGLLLLLGVAGLALRRRRA